MSPIRHFLSALKIHPGLQTTDVLSPQAFQTVLTTERARSDRSGWPFTLVSIKVLNGEQIDPVSKMLLEVVQERTRQIDYKGWYGGDLALILPYTHTDSANDLLNAIEERYARRVRKQGAALGAPPELEFTVYCYPPAIDRKVETV